MTCATVCFGVCELSVCECVHECVFVGAPVLR